MPIQSHWGLTRSVPSLIYIQWVKPGFNRRDDRPVFGYGNGIFKVCSRSTVIGHNSPAITQRMDMALTQGNHRLDGKAHTDLELNTVALASIVGHIRFLMHMPPDAMANILTDNSIAMLFGVRLNGIAPR